MYAGLGKRMSFMVDWCLGGDEGEGGWFDEEAVLVGVLGVVAEVEGL